MHVVLLSMNGGLSNPACQRVKLHAYSLILICTAVEAFPTLQCTGCNNNRRSLSRSRWSLETVKGFIFLKCRVKVGDGNQSVPVWGHVRGRLSHGEGGNL